VEKGRDIRKRKKFGLLIGGSAEKWERENGLARDFLVCGIALCGHVLNQSVPLKAEAEPGDGDCREEGERTSRAQHCCEELKFLMPATEKGTEKGKQRKGLGEEVPKRRRKQIRYEKIRKQGRKKWFSHFLKIPRRKKSFHGKRQASAPKGGVEKKGPGSRLLIEDLFEIQKKGVEGKTGTERGPKSTSFGADYSE